MKLLALSDSLDFVMRKTLDALGKRGHEVVIFEHPIHSKLDRKAIKALRREIRGFKPDVVFSHSTSGLSAALFATIGQDVKVVGYRGTQHRVSRLDPTNYLALLNPKVHKILCETPDIVGILEQAGVRKDKLVQACKPYSLDWVDDCLKHPLAVGGIDPNKLHLITVGSFDHRPHKGLQYLLEAMKQLPEATLTVIGTTDTTEATDNVIFLGYNKKATYYLPSHDVLVLPSTRDASPRTVREAQACGLPCIVSDIPGTRDLIVNGESGLVVEPASPDAIVAAVKELQNNPERRNAMSLAARENIRTRFDFDTYVDTLEKLFLS